MKSIESIEKYTSAYELCYYNISDDIRNALTAAETEAFKGVDDYESFAFYLVNGETALTCDGINGDVIWDPIQVEKFFNNILDYIRKNCEA